MSVVKRYLQKQQTTGSWRSHVARMCPMAAHATRFGSMMCTIMLRQIDSVSLGDSVRCALRLFVVALGACYILAIRILVVAMILRFSAEIFRK